MVASIFCNRLQKLEGRQDIEGRSPDTPKIPGFLLVSRSRVYPGAAGVCFRSRRV